ncbi:nucleoside diphosphate kinase regulator [Peptococcaceae bacterium 1198_IL3148]
MSNSRRIYITKVDKERLEKLISKEREFNPGSREYLKDLSNELEKAQVVEPKDIPSDVVTMNSKVELVDLDADEEMVYTLVYPEDADLSQDKISILAPIGTAILGYRVGEIVDWKVPNGVVQLKVQAILYQPEAAGDYEL